MQPTEDQIAALDNMLKWSQTNIWRHTLNGAAGTGKTTIARAFIDKVGVPKHKIAVTAPTHKAKKVISDATGYRAQTIQKLLGLRPNVEMDNFNPHRPVFLPIGEDSIGGFKMVLIDEGSMLNQAAFDLIKKKAEKYKIKILFMGDSYQLPPVGEIISPIFKGAQDNISTLTQVVRQESNNPMTKVLLQLRNDIKFKSNNAITGMLEMGRALYQDTGFKTLKGKSEEENEELFGAAILKMFQSEEYKDNPDYIKFLAYTNKSVEKWSEGLRKALLKEKADNLINEGEYLIGYKTIINKKVNSIIIENSEDYLVNNVEAAVSDKGFKGYYVTLSTKNDLQKRVFIVDTKDKETEDLYIAKVLALVTDAEEDRRNWKYYYQFTESHLSLNTYMYPNKKYKTLISKALYYSYGMTVHKSQGSTYTNVAINLPNMFINRKEHERNRLIYVAMSRASHMNLVLRN